jgi:23S rRNA (pseudouridine1915-N3)-methyltransferase
MLVQILCVGKIKEKYMRDAIAEYQKRLSRFCRFEIIEVDDISIPDKASGAEKEAVLKKEGELLLGKVKNGAHIICMCVEGKGMPTEEFADMIQKLEIAGSSHICFVIGGSLGLWDELKKKADLRLSLSSMTLTHQMARLFLAEQIYRAYKINRNETYHK